MDDNYNPSILEWLYENLSRNYMYDDAHVNVLEEALSILMNNLSKGLERNRRDKKCRSYDFEDLARLA